MAFDWDSYKVRFNSAGYSCWRPGRKFSNSWKQRILTDQDLWIIGDGHGRIELSDMDAELCSGRIVWMRPGHFYEVEQDPDHPLKIYWFHFDLLDGENRLFYPSIQTIPEYFHTQHGMHAMLLARTLFRLFKMRTGMDGLSEAACLQQLLKSILMLIEFEAGKPPVRASAPHSDIAEDAAQYLDEVTGQIIPVAELAGRFHLSRNQFTRIFTSYWGITPQSYQINSRINQAKYLLGSTDFSIRSIAAELGYADPYFFTRQFKQKTGCTPGRFRRKTQGCGKNIEEQRKGG